jgi:hypothetical protein
MTYFNLKIYIYPKKQNIIELGEIEVQEDAWLRMWMWEWCENLKDADLDKNQ